MDGQGNHRRFYEREERELSQQVTSDVQFSKMYDRISRLAKIGVWECDLATGKLTWTDTVYDLFGIPRGTAINREDTLKLYDATSLIEMEQLRSEAIRNGTGFTLDIMICTASGKQHWIRLTADIEQVDGKSVRIFGTKQDISAERAAQEKVSSLQTELIYLSRVSAMEAMASNLAHEVNQPLAAASNYISAAIGKASRGTVTPELSECLDAALRSTLRAGEIIHLLRKTSGRVPIVKIEFELEQVVKEALILAVAETTNLSITCDIDLSAPIIADRVQIQHVLANLIRNASEAAAGKACHITIRSSRDERQVEISVTDTGPGISDDILANVFESFVTTKPEGLGIGLSISRTIVEAHGGKIKATNLPGGGASISFTLPLMAMAPLSLSD